MISNFSLFKNSKYSIKIMVVGDKSVGKTTIINKLLNINDQKIDLEYSEIVSNDNFNIISYLYFDKIDIVLLIFDIMNADSFRYVINEWYKNIIKHNKYNLDNNDKQIIFFLIGNKSDLIISDIDKFRPNDPRDYAKENNINFHLINQKDEETYNNLYKDIFNTCLFILELKKNNIILNSDNINNKIISNRKNLEGLFNEIYGNKWKSNESVVDIYNSILNTNSFTNSYGDSFYNVYNNSLSFELNRCSIL